MNSTVYNQDTLVTSSIIEMTAIKYRKCCW